MLPCARKSSTPPIEAVAFFRERQPVRRYTRSTLMRITRKKSPTQDLPVCAVLLAGGRGTRFWPRSRTRTPKQLLNIVGAKTMLRETVDRLSPLVTARNIWVVTNVEQSQAVRRELRAVPAANILAEPVGRNTAAAIGLAAAHLVRKHGDALMAVLPSDAYIAEAPRYRSLVRAALELARTPGNMIVLGIPPTRPETGYGYIERAAVAAHPRGVAAYAVRRFTEKPELAVARRYAASGKYLWNAGMFFWRASTLLENLKKFLPKTHRALLELAATIGTPRYASALRRIYPRLESISIDYAVMEPATRQSAAPRVFVIPAKVGWSDIGSWSAVYELLASNHGAALRSKPGAGRSPRSSAKLAKTSGPNVSAGPFTALDAAGNYFWSPQKFVAAIGVHDLVVVETPDALLICSRAHSQDVAKIVKALEKQRLRALL
jgi:mannose-1-phosphate guanylyltransferase